MDLRPSSAAPLLPLTVAVHTAADYPVSLGGGGGVHDTREEGLDRRWLRA
jgi:hypothetical protein